MLEVGAPLGGRKVVELGRGVAAIGVGAEVGDGEAGIGFVGVELGVADFEFEALGEGGAGFPEEF